MMLNLFKITRRPLAKLQKIFSGDPLLHPLGHASNGSIDEALEVHGLVRADLFTLGTTLTPHRHRLAAMLAIHALSPKEITTDHWQELKVADNRCANCVNAKYCENWLRRESKKGTPQNFCPNAITFEQIKERISHTRLANWVHRATSC
jgi:hypothetical protein